MQALHSRLDTPLHRKADKPFQDTTSFAYEDQQHQRAIEPDSIWNTSCRTLAAGLIYT